MERLCYYHARVAYDGTQYHGWQLQAMERTIAGELMTSFQEVFSLPVTVVGASRTDAGVHAYDQVVRCTTLLDLDAEQLRIVWNRALPRDILIRTLTRTTEQFHPQQKVTTKTYWYHLFVRRPLPFYAPYGWELFYPLDSAKLRACLDQAIGTHDFRSFCTGSHYESTACTIEDIDLHYYARYKIWRIAVHGPRFLYHMVRRVVGSAIYIATRPHLKSALYGEILRACNPEHSLSTAPAHGLMLRRVRYQE